MAKKGRKICKELCNRCRFEMNISTGYGNQKNTGKFCGYSLIEKKCRTVDDGKIIPDCEKCRADVGTDFFGNRLGRYNFCPYCGRKVKYAID